MKRLIAIMSLTILCDVGAAQALLTLEECHALAESNYPLIKQRELILLTKDYTVANAATGSLPRISVGGQATYQSDVTQIPVEMPGVTPLSKDQYRVFGEVSQTIYHGGVVAAQKDVAEAEALTEARRHDVGMYQVRSRVNDLFFGILLLQEQVTQTGLAIDDLKAGMRRVEASIANGTALRSSADVLKAEMLKLEQRIIEMVSTSAAYRQMLGTMIGRSLDSARLSRPMGTAINPEVARPELALFQVQKRVLTVNEHLLTAAKKPRVEAFIQGGYGRPGLNMLDNDFNLYYLGGIRLSWRLSDYYALERERQIIELRRKAVDVEEETFLFNTQLSLMQHASEVTRLQHLIDVDDEIISLRTRVRETAEIQLEQGVITSTDFVREVNAEDQAKQARVLHSTQLLMARAKHKFVSGQ